MKIRKNSESEIYKNSDQCQAVIYSLDEKDIDSCVITVNGRYPDSGFCCNEVCKEVCYINNGSGILGVDDQEYSFEKGDILFIDSKEKYFWTGDFTMVVSCTPAWYPEQHTFIP